MLVSAPLRLRKPAASNVLAPVFMAKLLVSMVMPASSALDSNGVGLSPSAKYCITSVTISQAELAPGEVMVFSNAARLVLRNNGDIEVKGRVRITGRLFVNGRELGA